MEAIGPNVTPADPDVTNRYLKSVGRRFTVSQTVYSAYAAG
jgi:hypothetical protein